jgi:hypothetical protein
MEEHEDRTQDIKTTFKKENGIHQDYLFGQLFCLGQKQDINMYASAIATTNGM